MSNRCLAKLFFGLCLFSLGSNVAWGVVVTDTLDFKNATYLGSSNPTTESVTISQSYTVPAGSGGGTINYDLVITSQYIDSISGSSVSISGMPTDSGGASGGLGVNSPGGGDTGAIEPITDGAATSGTAYEQLKFELDNLVYNIGAIGPSSFEIDSATQLTVPANGTVSGNNTDTLLVTSNGMAAGFRISGVKVNFNITSVPEPSQWMMLGLVAIFAGSRSMCKRSRAAWAS